MPYKPDDPNGEMPPDNVPADKRAQWSAIWNSTYKQTGEEGRAFAAANAILEKQMTDKQMAILYRQEDVNYELLSSQMGTQQCQNCRWFCTGDGDESYCHNVENYPQDIVASGLCDATMKGDFPYNLKGWIVY